MTLGFHPRGALALLPLLVLACTETSSKPQDAGGAAAAHGLVVVMSDYSSTNVALAAFDGTTTVPSFLSSGTVPPTPLGLALSGDVVPPSDAPPSGRIVLIDRFGRNVITWAEPTTGVVTSQLAVGTGFESNPQDYVELDDTRAVVSRYSANPTPGQSAHDEGDDLLVIDTKTPAIVGRVAFPRTDGVPARPSAMTRVGDRVAVVLQRLDASFVAVQDGAVAFVDRTSLAVEQVLELSGLRNCGSVVASPAGGRIAVACSGAYDAVSNRYEPGQSDVALVDVTSMPAKVVRRLDLASTLGAALQPEIAFATDDVLVAKAYATADGTRPETVWAVSLAGGAPTQLHAATKETFALGALRCGEGTCVLADAESNVLRRWAVGATLTTLAPLVVESAVGLPPRHLGAY